MLKIKNKINSGKQKADYSAWWDFCKECRTRIWFWFNKALLMQEHGCILRITLWFNYTLYINRPWVGSLAPWIIYTPIDPKVIPHSCHTSQRSCKLASLCPCQCTHFNCWFFVSSIFFVNENRGSQEILLSYLLVDKGANKGRSSPCLSLLDEVEGWCPLFPVCSLHSSAQ